MSFPNSIGSIAGANNAAPLPPPQGVEPQAGFIVRGLRISNEFLRSMSPMYPMPNQAPVIMPRLHIQPAQLARQVLQHAAPGRFGQALRVVGVLGALASWIPGARGETAPAASNNGTATANPPNATETATTSAATSGSSTQTSTSTLPSSTTTVSSESGSSTQTSTSTLPSSTTTVSTGSGNSTQTSASTLPSSASPSASTQPPTSTPVPGPISINTFEEFEAIGNNPAGDYFLTSDIDASNQTRPIYYFNGTLDGNQQRVSGNQHCLFGHLAGEVRDLTVTHANVHHNASSEASVPRVGAVVCQLDHDGALENVHVKHSHVSSSHMAASAGGAVGGSWGDMNNVSATNCTVSTSGDGAAAGGVLGEHIKGHANHLRATDNTITTEGKKGLSGGVLGVSTSHSGIAHLHAHGNHISTTGDVSSSGGAIGSLHGNLNFAQAHNNTVHTQGLQAHAGGILGSGSLSSTTTHLTSKNNAVHTTGENSCAGGAIGSTNGVNAFINSLNNTLETEGAGASAGGAIGESESKVLEPMVWMMVNSDTDTAVGDDDDDDGGGGGYDYDDGDAGDAGDYGDFENCTSTSTSTECNFVFLDDSSPHHHHSAMDHHTTSTSTTAVQASDNTVSTRGPNAPAGGVMGLNQGVLLDTSSSSNDIQTSGVASNAGGTAGVNSGTIMNARSHNNAMLTSGPQANIGGNIGEQTRTGTSSALQAHDNTMTATGEGLQTRQSIGVDLSTPMTPLLSGMAIGASVMVGIFYLRDFYRSYQAGERGLRLLTSPVRGLFGGRFSAPEPLDSMELAESRAALLAGQADFSEEDTFQSRDENSDR